MNRREFLGGVALQLPIAAGARQVGVQGSRSEHRSRPAKPRRTMYFNDAQHFYLYAFDPPSQMQDAWRPVDELVGTAVNTLIYGVETAGGLFSDSKVAQWALADQRPFRSSY